MYMVYENNNVTCLNRLLHIHVYPLILSYIWSKLQHYFTQIMQCFLLCFILTEGEMPSTRTHTEHSFLDNHRHCPTRNFQPMVMYWITWDGYVCNKVWHLVKNHLLACSTPWQTNFVKCGTMKGSPDTSWNMSGKKSGRYMSGESQ